jgi:hypothetical protein
MMQIAPLIGQNYILVNGHVSTTVKYLGPATVPLPFGAEDKTSHVLVELPSGAQVAVDLRDLEEFPPAT